MPPSNPTFAGVYAGSQHSQHNTNSGQLAIYNNNNNNNTSDKGPKMWPLGLDDDWDDPNDETAFWAPSLSSLSLPGQSPTISSIADLWPQNNSQNNTQTQPWLPRTVGYGMAGQQLTPPAETYMIPRGPPKMAAYHDPVYQPQQQLDYLPSPASMPLSPAWSFYQPTNGLDGITPALGQKDTNLQHQQNKTTKTFKPMQMVDRERRRASASSTGSSAYDAPLTDAPPYPGISQNYRGDIHNPHNRGDHVPAHANTSLFLMGLPPATTVGDLLRAIAALGPTGRIFAASVNPPDPLRRLPMAAAKISYFTRAQAEHCKSLIDSRLLVMHAHTVRCAWNRDKKAPRRCVQASECRVLRIRGPRAVVNYAALTAYFGEKFRYELQGVSAVESGDEATMEWRFASFQSQAIAAKMALNQERKMVRVEYGRDPCEWGEYC